MPEMPPAARPTLPAELIVRLREARRVVVLSGAGVSAESGVPTFRDAQTGLWARFSPEDLATPEAFRRDPALVWGWYLWRRELVGRAEPNPGHRAIADLERFVPELVVVTQNVDGLHQRAGSQRVLELHGNIMRTKCFDCGRVAAPERVIDLESEGLPHCPACGGLERPDVVWFGEMLPEGTLSAAAAACRAADVCFVVGTSAMVYPAAGLPFEALTGGATVVEVNPQPTPFSARATHVLSGASGVVLPAMVAATWHVPVGGADE